MIVKRSRGTRTLEVMPVLVLSLVAITFLSAVPARAGWTVGWTNTAVKPNGDRLPPQDATMQIDKGRVRMQQPSLTMLMNYKKGTFTVLNTDRKFFWSGPVKTYVSEMARNRAEAIKQRGSLTGGLNYGMPRIDEDKLPEILIKKDDSEKPETIAGHPTTKYLILSNGELFQEIWLATDVDVAKDLPPAKVLAYQRVMSSGMLGKSSSSYQALHRSKEYRELMGKGFIVKAIVHHGAGGFERVATSLRQANVDGTAFDVPDNFRRVRLNDVFAPAKEVTGAPSR